METPEQIKLWAKQFRAIAQTGLTYGNDVFDQERYSEVLEITTEMLSHISNLKKEEINRKLPIESGYATPKIAVRGIVLQDQQVLMVKEVADGLWCLPGGWCDINLTPSQNVEKEIKEETGLWTKATRLVAFFDQTKYRPSVTMQHIYTIYFLCEVISGDLKSSIETTEVRFFPLHNTPPLSNERITKKQLNTALSVALDENKKPYFD